MDEGGDGVFACFFGCSSHMGHLASMVLPPFFSRPVIVLVILSFAPRQISYHVILLWIFICR
jgi:hypothetical protein